MYYTCYTTRTSNVKIQIHLCKDFTTFYVCGTNSSKILIFQTSVQCLPPFIVVYNSWFCKASSTRNQQSFLHSFCASLHYVLLALAVAKIDAFGTLGRLTAGFVLKGIVRLCKRENLADLQTFNKANFNQSCCCCRNINLIWIRFDKRLHLDPNRCSVYSLIGPASYT